MAEIRIGLIMHGVTGRMGKNQHLIRSIMAIREQGGVELSNGDRAMPDPILVGRNKDKSRGLIDGKISDGKRSDGNPGPGPGQQGNQVKACPELVECLLWPAPPKIEGRLRIKISDGKK